MPRAPLTSWPTHLWTIPKEQNEGLKAHYFEWNGAWWETGLDGVQGPSWARMCQACRPGRLHACEAHEQDPSLSSRCTWCTQNNFNCVRNLDKRFSASGRTNAQEEAIRANRDRVEAQHEKSLASTHRGNLDAVPAEWAISSLRGRTDIRRREQRRRRRLALEQSKAEGGRTLSSAASSRQCIELDLSALDPVASGSFPARAEVIQSRTSADWSPVVSVPAPYRTVLLYQPQGVSLDPNTSREISEHGIGNGEILGQKHITLLEHDNVRG